MPKNQNFAPHIEPAYDHFGTLSSDFSGQNHDTSAWSSSSTNEAGFNSISSWNSSSLPMETNSFTNESNVGERLRELKDKVVHGMGRKALDAVMNRLPDFGGKKDTVQNLASRAYENPSQVLQTGQTILEVLGDRDVLQGQALGYAKTAGLEVAGAGMTAAKETVMKYYGLEKDENEKLRVARKLKFGKAVVKTLVNPVGTASSVGARSAHAARRAVKQEAVGQYRTGRDNVINLPRPQQSVESYTSVVGF